MRRLQAWQADLLLLLVTISWGSTFTIVQSSVQQIPPFYFLGIRFVLAALALALFYWRRLRGLSLTTWLAGGLIGLVMWGGYSLQTFGLLYTSASQAAFITGLSVVIVPLLATVLLGERLGFGAILGAVVAAVGLGLMSLDGGLHISFGDLLVLGCAICFALHIVSVAHYTKLHDPIALTIIQILTVGLLSFLFSFLFEDRIAAVAIPADVWGAILLTGLIATAMAVLLQNILQPYTTPTRTALVFSTEPIFAALFAWVLINEILSGRQYLGAGLILAGMLLAELPWPGAGKASLEG